MHAVCSPSLKKAPPPRYATRPDVYILGRRCRKTPRASRHQPSPPDSLMVISHLRNLAPPSSSPTAPPRFISSPRSGTRGWRGWASCSSREGERGREGGGVARDHLFRGAVLTRRPPCPNRRGRKRPRRLHRELIIIARHDKKCPALFHRPTAGHDDDEAIRISRPVTRTLN